MLSVQQYLPIAHSLVDEAVAHLQFEGREPVSLSAQSVVDDDPLLALSLQVLSVQQYLPIAHSLVDESLAHLQSEGRESVSLCAQSVVDDAPRSRTQSWYVQHVPPEVVVEHFWPLPSSEW